MTSLRKLEHDRTRADLASVESLLDQLSDEDVMMRLGLESRRDELIAAIQGFDDQEEPTASAALFLVVGQSLAIEVLKVNLVEAPSQNSKT
jgi:hypothetical protein